MTHRININLSHAVIATGLTLLAISAPTLHADPAPVAAVVAPMAGDSAALFQAIGADNAVALNAALSAGANVNAVNKDGKTALMLAAAAGHTDLVQTLLDHQADPNRSDKDGRTALHYVLADANLEPVKKKRRGLGGLLNAAKALGGTALTMAPMALIPGGALLQGVAGGMISKGLAGAAQRQAMSGMGGGAPAGAGAGPEMLAKMEDLGDDATPEEKAQWHAFVEAMKAGDHDKAQEMQTDPDFAPVLAKAAAHMQAMAGQADGGASLVQALLSHGANPCITDKDGKTAQQCAKDRKLPVVARLLEQPGAATSQN